MIVGRLTLRTALGCPGRPTDRADRQRPELVERERPIREFVDDVLDPVQLGVPIGVVGLLPRLGPLERDVVGNEELTEPFPTDAHHPVGVIAQVLDQLADTPPGERLAQLLGAGLGRLDDERLIIGRDPAGTATRPLRVQRAHPQLVEPMNHLPHPILRRRHQPGDHRNRVPTRRRVHYQRTAPLHMRLVSLAATTTNNTLDLLAFLMGQPTDPELFRHANHQTTPRAHSGGPDHPTSSWSQH